eukprot:3282641-Ditylum_brightwellii.AAC.1
MQELYHQVVPSILQFEHIPILCRTNNRNQKALGSYAEVLRGFSNPQEEMDEEPTQGSCNPSTNPIRARKRPAVAIKVDDNPNDTILEPTSTSPSGHNGTSTSYPTLTQAYNSPKNIADNIVTTPALTT